jgi:hypothetical protein
MPTSTQLPEEQALQPSVAREPFLGLLWDLARAYQAFENYAPLTSARRG